MDFKAFAEQHGLIMRDLIPAKWVSTPTVDHPHKRNGRYKFMGDVGWVQNWATMEKPSMWRSDSKSPVQHNYRKIAEDADRERRELAEKASAKAGWILHQTVQSTHPYLMEKGFATEQFNVWKKDAFESILVIPMRIGQTLVGCQLINEQGDKKFLYGQSNKGATFTLDAKGIHIFCEGFATALSIRNVMKANKIRYTIHVCFSAGNMKEVARHIPNGIIVADNDASGTGESVAKETGKPYWISETVGEDFNDYHHRVGLFKASQSLKKVLTSLNH